MPRDWSSWIPGSFLAAGCLFTFGINQQQSIALRMSLDSIPLVLAGDSGSVGTIPQDQQDAAGMSSYIYRYYPKATPPLEIYVGYYDHQTQGKTIHSPKNCLPGSGWEALQQSQIPLSTALGSVTVNRYILQKKDQRALVLYWYQGRGRIAAGEYQVKWELLRDAALRGRTEEALVRVVVHMPAGTSESDANAKAELTAAALANEVVRVLPSW
ncbi:MAG: exosortase C-terminal domain/associated protein EpsI [Gemmatimonadales bacterium]